MKMLLLIGCFCTTIAFAQDAEATYQQFSRDFIDKLSQKTDTVLQYYHIFYERDPAVIGCFVWKENGKTLRYNYQKSKTDTIADAQPLWQFLFANYTKMKKEKVRPYAYLKNPKNPKSIVSYDYEVGQESEACKIYIKNTGFEIGLSTMAYDKTSVDGFTRKSSANINYDYNSKLKIRQFASRVKTLCVAP